MNDIAVIRLENLLRLKKTPSDLVAACGSTPSQWSDLQAGRKSFGEKLARKIEDGLRLPRGWLDHPHGRAEPTPTAQSPKLSDVLTELARSIAARPRLDRRQLEVLLPLLASDPDSRHETCAAISRLLAPDVAYTYTATWEETARDVARFVGDSAKLTPAEYLAAIDQAHAKSVRPSAVPLLKSG